MLPVISLDDEQFEEIMENARKMIPNLYPGWTDYNYHDPGITILEMLAWLKESQQFHLDQIGPGHIRRYLALLGERPADRVSARALVYAGKPDSGEILPEGTPFLAYQVPFETEKSCYLEDSEIAGLVSTGPGEMPWEMPLWQTGERVLQLSMFGKNPVPGCSFCVAFTKPLHPEREHSLYFRLYADYPVCRAPFSEEEPFIPLASLVLEVFSGGRFIPVARAEDETVQFLRNGFFRFCTLREMEPDANGRYWIRFRLITAEYDMAPVVEQVSLHELEVCQKHTICRSSRVSIDEQDGFESEWYLAADGGYEFYLSEKEGYRLFSGTIVRSTENGKTRFYFPDKDVPVGTKGLLVCFDREKDEERLVGEGNGFHSQEFQTQIRGLCAKGLELLVETEEGSGQFLLWDRAEDFSGCGPEDRCYVFEEERGIFRFGNCEKGMAPEGKILLVSGYTSLGDGGNVKAGSIGGTESSGNRSVFNREDAFGGRDPETAEQCWVRVHQKMKKIYRAVSYEDYEKLVMETPGLMIERARVIPVSARMRRDGSMDEQKVTLVAKPYSESPMPKLSRPYLENILNYLEPRRLLGTRVSILSPEYIGIIIFAEIETDSYARRIREELKKTLTEYFAQRGSDFGQPVPYGTVYGIIDVMEHVTQVRSISLDARGSGIRRNQNGDILLPANGLAYLKEWDCMISSAG